MSRKRGPWGQPGQRIYRTDGDFSKRRYEDEAAERSRQAKVAAAEIRADGEHYIIRTDFGPGTFPVTLSLEESERQFDKRMSTPTPGGFKALLGMAGSTAWHMGMYSNDPTIARMAMVHTAGEQIGVQRQISAQQQQMAAAQHAAERAQDKADQAEQMEMMAKAMAKAMFDEAEARRAS